MPNTIEFDFKGHQCTLIVPDIPKAGNPYVWRMEFLYAFNQADMKLLDMGYHIAYCSFCDEYGSERSIDLFKEFHDYIAKEYGLNTKASLFGFSRGGLYAFNYAVKYSDDVASVYLDAPVLDLRSWPGGFWSGVGSPDEWKDCKERVLGICSDDDTDNILINPVTKFDKLIKTGLPVLMIAGDSDDVVPFEENGKLLVEKYTDAGITIPVIIKPGCWHHPHSLEDVSPIVEFVESSYGF